MTPSGGYTPPPDFADAVLAAVLARDGHQSGDEVQFLAPCHEDTHPSATYNAVTHVWHCHRCGKGGGVLALADVLGVPTPPKRGRGRPASGKPAAATLGQVVDVYTYHDEHGTPLFRVLRYVPKDFRQQRPDGKGGWLWGLGDVAPTLYRLPELIAATPTAPVLVPEGEKDAHRLAELRLVATTSPMGAGKWRPEYAKWLRDRHVVVLPDNDEPGRAHAETIAATLDGVAAGVRVLELPGLPQKGDVSDWLDTGGDADKLLALVEATPERKPSVTPRSLADVVATFRKWLHMPDVGALEVALATVAANRAEDGDPVWLLLVATPGSGKTEVLQPLGAVPGCHVVGALSEAALLSGTPKRDRDANATGGVLRLVGELGQLVVKDFGALLAMHKDSRGPVLQALRDVYDGQYRRDVGADGGRVLAWRGKCGLVGGATPALDSHYAVMSSLGERFALYRLPNDEREERARQALRQAGREHVMRGELAEAVRGLFASVPANIARAELTEHETSWLVTLADFAVTARSSVERDAFSSTREIVGIPGAESPTRFVKVLLQLFSGLLAIGVPRERAWGHVAKVALDSVPPVRLSALDALRAATGELTTKAAATSLGLPTSTVKRALEDITAYNLAERDEGAGSTGDKWRLSEWGRRVFETARSKPGIWQWDISGGVGELINSGAGVGAGEYRITGINSNISPNQIPGLLDGSLTEDVPDEEKPEPDAGICTTPGCGARVFRDGLCYFCLTGDMPGAATDPLGVSA